MEPNAPRLTPDDVPLVLRGLLAIGDAIGVAKSHGMLRGDTEERLVAAGELAFEHFSGVLPPGLLAVIAEYVEECIAEQRAQCSLPVEPDQLDIFDALGEVA